MSKKIPFLLLSVSLFFVFVGFSYIVARERFNQIDFNTTVRLQDHISRKFDTPFTMFSLIGSAEVTAIIWLMLIIFLLIKRYFLSVLSLSLFWIGHFFEIFGKLFVLHPSPPHLFYRGTVDFNFPSQYVATAYSYPSGHMMRTTFLATFIFLYFFFRVKSSVKIPILFALIIFILLMAVSRIYLAEHWLSDVIGGTLLGTSLGVFAAIFIIPKKLKGEDNFS